MPRRRALPAALLVLGLAAIAMLAGGAAVLARRTALAEHLLVEALAARGVAPAAVRVVRLDLRGAELAALAVGPPETPDLAAVRIEADWSLAGLRAGRLDALRVEGLRVRAALGSEGLSLGALDPLLAGGGTPGGVPALPAPEITLADARLDLETPDGPAAGEASGTLRSDADGRLAGDFALALEHPLGRARATLTAAGPPDAVDFEAALRDDARRLSVTARGRADLAARSAELAWALAPLAFAPGALQPAALAPPLARLELADASGRVEARGTATLGAEGALAWSADVALRDLSFATPLARVARANGAFALAGPPLRTPRHQPLAIALLDLGVPLADGLVEWQLRRDGTLSLRRTRFAFAGGELTAEDVVVDPRRASAGALVLRARDLDLGQLLSQTRLEGLSGSGRIEGELPLTVREGAVRVTGGELHATGEGGTLRYRPSPTVAATADSRPHDLGIAIGAFSDFRYEALAARLDGALDGEVTIGLHVRGANPDFQHGRPVELNLNLEAHLADLVHAGQATYRVPAAVEERLRAFSEGRPSP